VVDHPHIGFQKKTCPSDDAIAGPFEQDAFKSGRYCKFFRDGTLEVVSKPQIAFEGPAGQRDFTSIFIKINEFNKRQADRESAAYG
jgi:hypothetical protein